MAQDNSIVVYSAHRHPRLRYALRLLSDDLGYRFRLITDRDRWQRQEETARMLLGSLPESDDPPALFLPAHPILSGAEPTETDLEVTWRAGVPYFFPAGDAEQPAHDLLACLFFAVSRYEEYGVAGEVLDEHWRFPGVRSHADRNDYLHLPVARIWARVLADRLRGQFPELPAPEAHAFYFQPTYDIDLLWAYRYRGWRGTAAGVRDLLTGQFSRAAARFGWRPADDPYDTLPSLLSLHRRLRRHEHVLPQIFWLMADDTDPRDPNPYPAPAAQRVLTRELSKHVLHGIHPGYHSLTEPDRIRQETARLREVTRSPVEHSRFHFLRFQLPGSYQNLLDAGLRHDHSMGYADRVGWRAGTNLPHKWYDLEREEMTGLTVHPFAAMDATLRTYLGYGPDEAYSRILHLAEHLQGYGGPFPLLWHNSSFADDFGWAGWWDMYVQMVGYLENIRNPATSDRTDR